MKNPPHEAIFDALFETPARARVLKLFLRNPKEALAQKDIARRTRLSSAALKKQIVLLLKIGFLRKRGGRNTLYALNAQFPLVSDLESMVQKSFPLPREAIVKTLSRSGSVKLIVLAGIFLNKEQSRADLLVVGDRIRPRKLEAAVREIEAAVGRELNYTSFETKDFLYRHGMFDRFVRDILEFPHEKLVNKLRI